MPLRPFIFKIMLCALLGAGVGLVKAQITGDSASRPITTAAAIRALRADQAGRSLPVKLEGVVILTTSDPAAMILMDDTEGLYVLITDEMLEQIRSGDWLEMTGTTGPGDFAPIAIANQIWHLGKKPLPKPVRVSIANMASGGFDARWVELEGIVRSLEPTIDRSDANLAPEADGSRNDSRRPKYNTVLTLAEGAETMRFRVAGKLDAAKLVDARVRVRGVCFNVHNANRQFVRASVLSMGADAITIITPAPDNPFDRPLSRVAELLQFSPTGFDGHRAHVQGVVTSHQAGDTLWIRDGERGLKVRSKQPGSVSPGDLVDVVGFAENTGYSPSMEDAIYRRVSAVQPPQPIPINSPAEALAHAADLVQITAELVEVRESAEGVRLSLSWNKAVIQALLPAGAEGANSPHHWEEGSFLQLAGICSLEPKNVVPESGLWLAQDFQLLLRGPEDVVVLKSAPWLNTRRTLWLLCVVAVVLVLGIIGLSIVSRRRILQREEERKMAEVEFTAMLRERNRVARDIHDTLAQGLNAVSIQLELAKNAGAPKPTEALNHVAIAHRIVRSCITEARESIWDMRSQVLEKTDLAGALDHVLKQLTSGLPLQASLLVSGPSRRLAPLLENSLLRLGQESIANVIRHAQASTLSVELAFDGSQVRLSVRDNGVGFDPIAVDSLSSRFGMAGMRERVASISGNLTINTAPGQGTTVVVTVEQRI